LPENASLASTPAGQLDQLREIILEELKSVVTLEVDGQRLELKAIRSEISARHHIRFYCFLEAELEPLAGERSIRLHDGSFADLQNQLRIALRPRGTELVRTNVEPLIVRADRLYLIELSPDDQHDARTIRGSFVDPNIEVDESPSVESQVAANEDPPAPNDPARQSVNDVVEPESTERISHAPSNQGSSVDQVPGSESAKGKPSQWLGLQGALTILAGLLILVGCVLLLRSDFANRWRRRSAASHASRDLTKKRPSPEDEDL
jgi:hypothetical protein